MKYQEYHDAVAFILGMTNLTQRQYMVYRENAHHVFTHYKKFLAFLGHPERGIRAVQVAGSAGKGSTTHLLHHMLRADGRTVGSFYSPYVTTPIDGILINNAYISPKEYAGITWELKDALQRFMQKERWDPPSFFEIKTALAFFAFKRAKVDWMVLETGLGGELDATNAVPKAEAAIITNIGWDHAPIIGPTLKDIARAKAGIIKKGTRHVLTAEQRPRFVKYFHQRAQRAGATFTSLTLTKEMQTAQNILLAKAAAEKLGVSRAAQERALAQPGLPGRFETVARHPRVLLDSAHNNEKIHFLKEKLERNNIKTYTLVFTSTASKDAPEMLRTLAPQCTHIVLTRYATPFRKVYDLGALYRTLSQKQRQHTTIELDPLSALALAKRKTPQTGTILVTGSTFLVGDIRKVYIPEAEILRARSSYPAHGTYERH
ncbi:MAG: Mur ligase family protein [Patescibacteria group bacterium]|jgi:dihydrofolate synthase/folylpolyglutamate synthase